MGGENEDRITSLSRACTRLFMGGARRLERGTRLGDRWPLPLDHFGESCSASHRICIALGRNVWTEKKKNAMLPSFFFLPFVPVFLAWFPAPVLFPFSLFF